MNNYAEITIEGKKVPLLFGMIAAEEFYRLQIDKDIETLNNTQMIAEIMYAGAYNHAVVNRSIAPSYAFIVDGVDGLYADDNGIVELNAACSIYQESRFGKNVSTLTEKLKKNEIQLNQSPSTGNASESLHIAD